MESNDKKRNDLMKVLYDVNLDEILHLRKFTFEESTPGHTSYYTSYGRGPAVYNSSIEVNGFNSTYIKDWYLQTLQQTNGRLHYASEYKRDLFVTNLKNRTIKLVGCFIKSVAYMEDDSLTVELSCDTQIIGDTFPELKMMYRNKILTSLGI